MRVCFALAILFMSGAARATVTEPNGLVVPGASSSGSETSLQTFFATQGEAIDWKLDAHVTPSTFSPLCDFTAKFVLNEAGGHFGLGWYNVVPGATVAPTLAEIVTIVPANSPVGTVVTSANIRNHPSYKNGLIGFALLGGQTHYSEQKWNTVCTGCGTAGPWALALVYQSKKIANAYYLALEAGTVTASAFHNDGDFNDDVFLLSGLACAGAGQTCSTGLMGACDSGITECDASGALVCKQIAQPGTETCNGIDDDCNGKVDDGVMCPTGQVCDRGRCVDPCGAAEFPCPGALVCDQLVCIEASCVGVQCPAGQVCQMGTCKGACDGVVCPFGQVCRVGRCADPCKGVTCGTGQVCQGGACVPSCDCLPCGAAKTCAMSGQCVDTGCGMVTCGPGTHCVGGACVDNCMGAVCPPGQACQAGNCVDLPPATDMAGTTDGDGGSRMNPRGGATGCACDIGGPRRPLMLISLLVLLLWGVLFFTRSLRS